MNSYESKSELFANLLMNYQEEQEWIVNKEYLNVPQYKTLL